eukprot:7510825-Pyramimonas_sp.AAC.1
MNCARPQFFSRTPTPTRRRRMTRRWLLPPPATRLSSGRTAARNDPRPPRGTPALLAGEPTSCPHRASVIELTPT